LISENKELGPIGLVACLYRGFQVYRLVECGQVLLHAFNQTWLHILKVMVMERVVMSSDAIVKTGKSVLVLLKNGSIVALHN